MSEPAPFRIGINYWPAGSAMQWWNRFDAGEVADDFARIARGGFDSVRLFLLWEAFQPDPNGVDPAMLERLVEVADHAFRAGLRIMPTLFTGHMSGANWIPRWALGGTDRDPRFRVIAGGQAVSEALRNWYTDPMVQRAQAKLASECAAAIAGHPALWAWDLGNENSNCVVPPDRAAGLRWLEEMTSAIRSADPGAQVTTGLHMEDLEQDRHMGPHEVAQTCDFLTMHGYPIYATWSEGPTDEYLAPFLAEVTRWLGDGRDVLFSEFGLPTHRHGEGAERGADGGGAVLVEEEAAARYTRGVLDGLLKTGSTGAMLWCYADYVPDLWTSPPLDEAVHERSFGLWRADGSAKPAVDAVRGFGPVACAALPNSGWIDIEPDRYWDRPDVELPRLYRRYLGR